jgi:PAS domain S-box-containing protein
MKRDRYSENTVNINDTGAGDRETGDRTAEQGIWVDSAKREDLLTVLDYLPCMVSVLSSPFGKALYINRQMLDTLGLPVNAAPMHNDFAKQAIPDRKKRSADRKRWKCTVDAGGGVEIAPFLCGDGETRFFEIRTKVLRKDMILNSWTDVTERQKAEVLLKESEKRFRSFFEDSTDPLLLFEGETVVGCNKALVRLFNGQGKDEIEGRTLASLLPDRPSRRRSAGDKAATVLRTALREGSCRTEWTICTLDKRLIPIELSITAIKYQGRDLLFVVLRDITQWKEAEKVLLNSKTELEATVKERTSELTAAIGELRGSREKLRHLSEHLQQAREEERTRVSREVHDRVGQFLTGLKMDLAYHAQNPPLHMSDLLEQMNLMAAKIDGAIQSVQDICSELRPPILGHFGITAAIAWYLEEFEKRTGIRCRALMDSRLPPLDKDLELLLFRIFQEATTNVARHARATRMTIGLRYKRKTVELTVKDNGRGILKEEVAHSRSLGIIGIRERVRFWGGHADFRGNPGRGTTVIVSLPVSNDVSVRGEAKEGGSEHNGRGSSPDGKPSSR